MSPRQPNNEREAAVISRKIIAMRTGMTEAEFLVSEIDAAAARERGGMHEEMARMDRLVAARDAAEQALAGLVAALHPMDPRAPGAWLSILGGDVALAEARRVLAAAGGSETVTRAICARCRLPYVKSAPCACVMEWGTEEEPVAEVMGMLTALDVAAAALVFARDEDNTREGVVALEATRALTVVNAARMKARGGA